MPDFILGAPTHFAVEYASNDLTDPAAVVDTARATAQFNRLFEKLGGADRVAIIPADSQHRYPDFTFVSNAGLFITDSIFIPSRFHVKERREEEDVAAAWVSAHHGTVIRLPEEEGLYFEGQGDCRWSHGGTRLWIGFSAGRTTRKGAEAVRSILKPMGITVTPLHIRDPRTYHLDLCLCPLPNGRALWHSGSFLPAGKESLRAAFPKGLIDVPVKNTYGCNCVVLDARTLLTPRLADSQFRSWMAQRTGMRIVDVNVSEFQKAGGSVSCMVLLCTPSRYPPTPS